jgi:hypothetical protein
MGAGYPESESRADNPRAEARLVRFASGIAGFAGATGGFFAAVRVDPLGDRVPMDAESGGGVRNSLLVPAVRLLNVEFLKFFQGFIEHNMTIKHVIDYCFQTGAYLHLLSSPI